MIRLQIVFGQDRNGWTETYYRNGTAVAPAMVAAQLLGNARVRMLGNMTQVDYLRIQNDDVPPEVLIRPLNSGAGNGAAEDQDFAWTAYEIRFTLDNGRTITRSFRGIPDIAATEKVGRINDVVAGQNEIDIFVNALTGGSWGDRLNNLGPDNPKIKIASITYANGLTTITPVGPVNVQPDDFVVFYGMRCACGWDRRSRVVSSTSEFFTVYGQPPLPAGFNLKKAFYRLEVPLFAAMTTGTLVGISKRDTGRPLGLKRGRRSSPRCCV